MITVVSLGKTEKYCPQLTVKQIKEVKNFNEEGCDIIVNGERTNDNDQVLVDGDTVVIAPKEVLYDGGHLFHEDGIGLRWPS